MIGILADRPARASRSVVLIPLLACLVEGAWIAVVDAVFGAGSRRQPLGPLTFGLIGPVTAFPSSDTIEKGDRRERLAPLRPGSNTLRATVASKRKGTVMNGWHL